MKKQLLDRTDYQTISGKSFIKKSGWRKLALVFNICDEIAKEERDVRDDGSFVWTFRVRAIAPNGRFTEAVGSCDSRERKFSKTEHDVKSTAHTRAKSRAISDLIAAGEISAEEMTSDDLDANQASTSDDSNRDAKSKDEGRAITSAKTVGKSAAIPTIDSAPERGDLQGILERFQWYTKDGSKTRQWKMGDDYAWANGTGFGEGLEKWNSAAEPLVAAIKDAGGAVIVGAELISIDADRKQILRRKLEG